MQKKLRFFFPSSIYGNSLLTKYVKQHGENSEEEQTTVVESREESSEGEWQRRAPGAVVGSQGAVGDAKVQESGWRVHREKVIRQFFEKMGQRKVGDKEREKLHTGQRRHRRALLA